MNQWRSPTAEALYRDDPRLEVRSAGIRASAKRKISRNDVAWADAIFVMERGHQKWIRDEYQDVELPPIIILDIPNDLEYMDAELQRLLKLAIDPEIALLLST
jgi:predicted protein tyrosine phosphatase